MIGRLPHSLQVNGQDYPIDPDFRNILAILEAMDAQDISPSEKVFICVRRLFITQPDDLIAAYKAASHFIDAGHKGDGDPSPRLIDWSHDESIIFPAINKVAGMEVRATEFLHWHTFVGFFMETGEGVWSTVLSVRQKKAKGKKLEKWEREFYNANRTLCSINGRGGTGKKSLADSFAELVEKE